MMDGLCDLYTSCAVLGRAAKPVGELGQKVAGVNRSEASVRADVFGREGLDQVQP